MSLRITIHTTFETLPEIVSNSFFNSKVLFNNYISIEGYEPFYLIGYNNNKIIAYWLLVVIHQSRSIPSTFSSRCVAYGYPAIISTLDEDKIVVVNAMLTALTELMQHKVLYVEVRQVSYDPLLTSLFIQHHFQSMAWLNVVNHLPQTIEEAFTKLNDGKRRQIKNNERLGLQVRPAASHQEVIAFVQILQQLYSHLAKPLPPLHFFTRFYETTCQQRNGVILVAIYQNHILGGILCPIDTNTLYEWYICSDNKLYRSITPGVSLTWGAICYAIENGFRAMDFMGAGKANRPYGVRNFKLSFGGELIPVLRYRYKTTPLAYFMIHTILSPFRNWLIKQKNRRQVMNNY